MEIAPGVHSIPVGSADFMGLYAPNVYLIVDSEAALIDSGYREREMAYADMPSLEEIIQGNFGIGEPLPKGVVRNNGTIIVDLIG